MRYVSTEVGSWRVTHDASGKVLVRRFEKGEEVLFATAKWSNDGTVDRLQTKVNVPSDEGWTDVDKAVRTALDAAKDMGPDPRLDPAVLPPQNPKEAADPVEGLVKKPFNLFKEISFIFTVLVVIALIVGLFITRSYWLPFLKGSGAGNGEKCISDSDCRSGNCHRKVCQGVDKARGERCTEHDDCRSGSCYDHICN